MGGGLASSYIKVLSIDFGSVCFFKAFGAKKISKVTHELNTVNMFLFLQIQRLRFCLSVHKIPSLHLFVYLHIKSSNQCINCAHNVDFNSPCRIRLSQGTVVVNLFHFLFFFKENTQTLPLLFVADIWNLFTLLKLGYLPLLTTLTLINETASFVFFKNRIQRLIILQHVTIQYICLTHLVSGCYDKCQRISID